MKDVPIHYDNDSITCNSLPMFILIGSLVEHVMHEGQDLDQRVTNALKQTTQHGGATTKKYVLPVKSVYLLHI